MLVVYALVTIALAALTVAALWSTSPWVAIAVAPFVSSGDVSDRRSGRQAPRTGEVQRGSEPWPCMTPSQFRC